MDVYRKKPEIIHIDSDDSSSCIWFPVQIVMWFFSLFIVANLINGAASKLEQQLCVVIAIVTIYLLFRSKAKIKQKKEKWHSICIVAWLPTVDRYHFPGGTFQDGYGDIRSSSPISRLTLDMNTDQRAAALYTKNVQADICEKIYRDLENRTTVCVNYQPENPLVFFLVEEV